MKKVIFYIWLIFIIWWLTFIVVGFCGDYANMTFDKSAGFNMLFSWVLHVISPVVVIILGLPAMAYYHSNLPQDFMTLLIISGVFLGIYLVVPDFKHETENKFISSRSIYDNMSQGHRNLQILIAEYFNEVVKFTQIQKTFYYQELKKKVFQDEGLVKEVTHQNIKFNLEKLYKIPENINTSSDVEAIFSHKLDSSFLMALNKNDRVNISFIINNINISYPYSDDDPSKIIIGGEIIQISSL